MGKVEKTLQPQAAPGWGWEPPGVTDAPVPAPHVPSAALIPPFEFVHP